MQSCGPYELSKLKDEDWVPTCPADEEEEDPPTEYQN